MTDGCVQFSKNSWHYKATNYVFPHKIESYNGTPRPINLCPYMRAVLASIFLISFVAPWRKLPYAIQDNAWLVQAELIFLTLVVICAGAMDFADTYRGNDRLPVLGDMVLIGFFGGNLVGVVGGALIALGFKLKDYLDGRPSKNHKTRGLIKTYVASKHDKICPCVEFEDDGR